MGLYFAPLAGGKPTDGLVIAFGGFGHQALITICALMIMGRGLVVTGALEPFARLLESVFRINGQLGLLVALLIAFFLSMFVNDTPVMVLLLPILVAIGGQRADGVIQIADADQCCGVDRRNGDDNRHLDQHPCRFNRCGSGDG